MCWFQILIVGLIVLTGGNKILVFFSIKVQYIGLKKVIDVSCNYLIIEQFFTHHHTHSYLPLPFVKCVLVDHEHYFLLFSSFAVKS